jgi:hypothetical protein
MNGDPASQYGLITRTNDAVLGWRPLRISGGTPPRSWLASFSELCSSRLRTPAGRATSGRDSTARPPQAGIDISVEAGPVNPLQNGMARVAPVCSDGPLARVACPRLSEAQLL